MYYGPEMVSQAFTEWAAARGIAVRYIQPGKPNQNAFIERFNKTYRTEVLDAHLFANLQQVQFMPRLTLAPKLYQPLST
jgi:putative transposase